jgi:hypothetical protein
MGDESDYLDDGEGWINYGSEEDDEDEEEEKNK